MGTIVGSLIGLALAAFGFAAMRDPMRLNLNPFPPSAKGYYQRMVLDTTMRIQLRVLGVYCAYSEVASLPLCSVQH